MNIIKTDYEGHSEITVRDASGVNLHCYILENKEEAKAFIQGWCCCQSVINGLVQSLPKSYEVIKK